MKSTKRRKVTIQERPKKSVSELRPSDFTNKPYDSVLGNGEAEIVACNIMRILASTFNTFRPITWEEYKERRMKDGHFSESEKELFFRAVVHCVNAEKAIAFSSEWKLKLFKQQ